MEDVISDIKKEPGSRDNYSRIAYHVVLLVLVSFLVWEFAGVWYKNVGLGSDVYFATADKPFVFRVFVPLITRFLVSLGGNLADLAIILVIFLTTVGFAYSLQYLYTAFWKENLFTYVTVILGVELLFLLLFKDKKTYDTSTVFFFTLSLAFLARNKFIGYFCIFPLACMNRETTIFLTLFYAIYFFNKQKKSFYLSALAFQILVYLTIRFLLIFVFFNNPGDMLQFWFFENMSTYITKPFQTLVFIIVLVTVLYFARYKWNCKPLFLRSVFLVLFPFFFLLYLLVGFSFEFRVLIEVYPVVFLLSWPALANMLHLKSNPLSIENL